MLKYKLNAGDPPWSFVVSHKPYKQVVNNGYYIHTQSDILIEQLNTNEYTRGSEVVDWFLFKGGKSVLIDNYNNAYLCQVKTNYSVELGLLLLTDEEKQRRLGDVLN